MLPGSSTRARPRRASRLRWIRRARRSAGRGAKRSRTPARRRGAAPRPLPRVWASGDRRLQVRVVFEGFEAARHRAGEARRFAPMGSDDQELDPAPAFLIGGHAVAALEDRLLDPAVRRDLDRVPDRQAVWCHRVMRFVDLAIDRQPQRFGFGRRAQPRRLAINIGQEVQLKLEPMTGRRRVETALAMEVADRPPVGAWGHTYREEWSPDDLAAITVERARRFGWDFVKFQPRASTFAEAFGSVYKPSGHRMKGPVMEKAAVPDVEAWRGVRLANPIIFDEQVESIGIVARELGRAVPVIQTVFSPLTVAGYLVGKSKSRVLRQLRKQPELVRPALDRIADALIDFSR